MNKYKVHVFIIILQFQIRNMLGQNPNPGRKLAENPNQSRKAGAEPQPKPKVAQNPNPSRKLVQNPNQSWKLTQLMAEKLKGNIRNVNHK